MLMDKFIKRSPVVNQMVTGSRLTGYIVNVMRSPVIERLMVRGSQVALKHVFYDMETRTLVVELRWRAINRWVPCGEMDRRLKIPHSAKIECGFQTTPEECLYDGGLIGLQYSLQGLNTIHTHTINVKIVLRLLCIYIMYNIILLVCVAMLSLCYHWNTL